MSIRVGAATPTKAYHGATQVAVYRGEVLELAKTDFPHPTFTATPDHAGARVAISDVVWRWTPDTATSIRVELPDGEVVTDLARRSHTQRSFARPAGQDYPDLTGTLVATNAAGSTTVQASLFRWTGVSVTTVVRQLTGTQINGVPFSRVSVATTITGRPFPDVITISPESRLGAPSSHQLARWFSYETSNAQHQRSHTFVMQRPAASSGAVNYTIHVENHWRDGTELSQQNHTFSVNW